MQHNFFLFRTSINDDPSDADERPPEPAASDDESTDERPPEPAASDDESNDERPPEPAASDDESTDETAPEPDDESMEVEPTFNVSNSYQIPAQVQEKYV